MFGGYDSDNGAFVTTIWRLSNNLWTEEGILQQVARFFHSIFSKKILQKILENWFGISDLI